MQTVTTAVPTPVHKSLVAFCEKHGCKIRFVVREAIREYIEKRQAA